MIISRYLNREVLNTLFGVIVILLLIFLSQRLVRYLSYAASGKIASSLIVQLLGFEIPYLLALLLPLALYLGIILAYGRLYADSEMNVLQACGFSVSRLYWVTGVSMFIIFGIVSVLMFWVNPMIAAKKDRLLAESATNGHILDTLMPGRFQVLNDGNRVVYVEHVSHTKKEARNIFLAEQKNGETAGASAWGVLSAERGYEMKIDGSQYMVAENGARYEGVPGQNDYKIIEFKKYAVRVLDTLMNQSRLQEEALPTWTLMQERAIPNHAAELQWRISMPLSVVILALLAIPLSRVRPRQGRFSHLFPALLIYVVYANLLLVSRSWIEDQSIPAMLGMWWVHGVLLAFFGLFLFLQMHAFFRNRIKA